MKFEEWVKGIENAAIKGLCSTHPNICKMIYNEGQKDIEKALKEKGVCLQSELDELQNKYKELKKENAELKERNEGYNRNRDKLIAMGFPTFKSCKEYSGKLANLQKENEELKEANIELQKVVQQREQRGLEVQEDLLKENAELDMKRKAERQIFQGIVEKKNEQLTKAKDLLAKWVELYKPKIDTFLPTPIQVDTEQFLKE